MAYKFSPELEEKFQWLLTRYPEKQAVLLPLLHRVQAEAGYLSPEAIEYVAERMEMSPAQIKQVASFYTMFHLNKKGKYVLQICHNLSCYLRGSDEVIAKTKEILGIEENQTSADGLFTLERAECLGSCYSAPVMQINDWDFCEELDVDRIEKILALLKEGKAACPSHTERLEQGGVA